MSDPRRLIVVFLMRRPAPGQHSVERVFDTVVRALPVDIEPQVIELPHVSKGVLPRVRNLVFTSRLRADVVHVTGDVYYCALAIRRQRCVLTILDLVSLTRLNGWRRKAVEVLWYRLPVWWARYVTTISEATQDELLRLIPSASGKVSVVACPARDEYLAAQRDTERWPLSRVLQVGTGENKNVERVFLALEGLPIHLRIVGTLSRTQRRLLNESALSFSTAENVSDEQMLQEYLTSDMLLFASTYEGFGLPIVEAQAVGLPVVTSNLAPMPEVAGGGALFVDPFSVSAIHCGVERMLDSRDLALSLIAIGRANARRYEPSAVAELYAAIYRRCCEASRRQ